MVSTAGELPAEKPAPALLLATLLMTAVFDEPKTLIPATLRSSVTRSSVAFAEAPVGLIVMPRPALVATVPLLRTMVSRTWSWLLATVGAKLIPDPVKLLMVQFSTQTLPP